MSESESPQRGFSHYNPVKVSSQDTVGAVFLGILALVLLILYLRAQRRNAALELEIARRGP